MKDPVCGMQVSEKDALKLRYKGEEYYFCGRRCLDKFREEHDIPDNECPSCGAGDGKPFYRNRTFIVFSVLAFLSILSYAVPQLEAFRESLWAYFKRIWWAILLGLVLGGFIDHFVPRKYITGVLAKPRKRTILYSVVLGFLMSACSHGILALSIELHRKGASPPAVVAFLLAAPWANLTITIMLIGFFGLKALYMILAAIFIALVTGFVFQFLQSKGLIEKNPNEAGLEEGFSVTEDIRARVRDYEFSLSNLKKDIKGVYDGAVSLGNMVLWWILIGMGIASLAGAYVPEDVFRQYMGPTMAGLMITLLVATVIEVCSEGSAPMAFEIFRSTGAFGNSFVFLMAGVATDYTEIGLLWSNVGKKTAIWLPVVTVPQVIVFGMIANMLF
ncbi:MAG: YHS domain-containing protein [Candidatus Omnitrophica bacterium]|nr:YHS domain-containing protein [Candidatus Omnitrophota bacterium]